MPPVHLQSTGVTAPMSPQYGNSADCGISNNMRPYELDLNTRCDESSNSSNTDSNSWIFYPAMWKPLEACEELNRQRLHEEPAYQEVYESLPKPGDLPTFTSRPSPLQAYVGDFGEIPKSPFEIPKSPDTKPKSPDTKPKLLDGISDRLALIKRKLSDLHARILTNPELCEQLKGSRLCDGGFDLKKIMLEDPYYQEYHKSLTKQGLDEKMPDSSNIPNEAGSVDSRSDVDEKFYTHFLNGIDSVDSHLVVSECSVDSLSDVRNISINRPPYLPSFSALDLNVSLLSPDDLEKRLVTYEAEVTELFSTTTDFITKNEEGYSSSDNRFINEEGAKRLLSSVHSLPESDEQQQLQRYRNRSQTPKDLQFKYETYTPSILQSDINPLDIDMETDPPNSDNRFCTASQKCPKNIFSTKEDDEGEIFKRPANDAYRINAEHGYAKLNEDSAEFKFSTIQHTTAGPSKEQDIQSTAGPSIQMSAEGPAPKRKVGRPPKKTLPVLANKSNEMINKGIKRKRSVSRSTAYCDKEGKRRNHNMNEKNRRSNLRGNLIVLNDLVDPNTYDMINAALPAARLKCEQTENKTVFVSELYRTVKNILQNREMQPPPAKKKSGELKYTKMVTLLGTAYYIDRIKKNIIRLEAITKSLEQQQRFRR